MYSSKDVAVMLNRRTFFCLRTARRKNFQRFVVLWKTRFEGNPPNRVRVALSCGHLRRIEALDFPIFTCYITMMIARRISAIYFLSPLSPLSETKITLRADNRPSLGTRRRCQVSILNLRSWFGKHRETSFAFFALSRDTRTDASRKAFSEQEQECLSNVI